MWLRTAAEVAEVHLGEVIRFSSALLFFPDCRVVLGGDICLRDERLADVGIPLLVDRDQLLADLLAHPPGTFAYPGNTIKFTATWEQANPAQVKDYLWYALENWFFTFSYRVEFDVGMNLRQLEDFSDFPWYSCYAWTFAERIELTSRSVGWGG